MAEFFLVFIFLIPTVLGLSELLHILKLNILKPKKPSVSYKVIILTDNFPVEQMLFEIEKYKWLGKHNGNSLIFVNSLLSFKNLQSCKAIAEKNSFSFCKIEEVKKYIEMIFY